MVNGIVEVYYTDGTRDSLLLKNPDNWWPIEQDYYVDGAAFTAGVSKPYRIYLRSGDDTRSFHDFSVIKGFTNRAVEGGAATLLDLPLNPRKALKSLQLKAVANDVLIGLMSLTLVQ